MKDAKETEKIHIVEKPKKPDDIEELKKNLLSTDVRETETVSLGVNRKQFFIRLPTRMTDRINLTKDDKMKVILSGSPDKIRIELEVVKNARET